MEFTVATSRKSEFIENIIKLCKKFKINSYELVWGDRYKLYTEIPSYEDGDFDVFGYDVTLIVSDFDKFTDTGFTYLGSVKTDFGAVFTTPSRYAIENEINISDLKEEIETFPCHECGKKIARKIIHVFKEDTTGNITVYGSGCSLKKFGIDLVSALRKFQSISQSISEGGYARIGTEYMSSHLWSKLAYYNIINFGYVSRSKAYNEMLTSTDSEACDLFYILTSSNDTSIYATNMRKEMPAKLEVMDFDFDEMKKWAVKWVDSLEDNDFKFNLNTALEVMVDGYILPNLSGYLAYMTFKYWYDNKKVQEKKVEYNTDYSDLNVGDKFKKIRVEIVNEYIFEGKYGITHIYTMKDLDTNYKYKWFTSKELDADFIINISSGTIKAFEDHEKYGKAIVITRGRAIETDEKAGDKRFTQPEGIGA